MFDTPLQSFIYFSNIATLEKLFGNHVCKVVKVCCPKPKREK